MMKNSIDRLFFALLALLAPTVLMAQEGGGGGSLSFAPPPSDASVVFLGNIFGVVDGVLHGSGSMLMGTLFGVFNSAVMALGGIVIMYTLMVSTMNTAQEGQMLGQKWSSIWVPIRSTIGLALLVPKASGYCMMQIFVMWVVLQGVGAADKIWNAALDYIKGGGAIVRQQQDPLESLFAGGGDMASGATVMLSGQVCMTGLQKILQQQRDTYIQLKQKGAGPCSGTPDDVMKAFCETPVPDFVNTFNAVSTQTGNIANVYLQENFTVNMPNVTSQPYSALNGICGKVTWDNFLNKSIANLLPGLEKIKKQKPSPAEQVAYIQERMARLGLNAGDLQTVMMSRAIAVQQMYVSLTNVSRQIVDNIPGVGSSMDDTDEQPVSIVARQPFGVPLNSAGEICGTEEANCISWGMPGAGTAGKAPIFSGTEFQGAISDYNAVMGPALTLMSQAGDQQNAKKSRAFIDKAREQGWIMAGSYFFDLARLNQEAAKGRNLTDQNSGLGQSAFDPTDITKPFGDGDQCGALCRWLNRDQTNISKLVTVTNGSGMIQPEVSPPSSQGGSGLLNQLKKVPIYSGKAASTVYGFIDNSMHVRLPGQPGETGPRFAMKLNISFGHSSFSLPKMNMPCGGFPILGCLVKPIGDMLYNVIIRGILNFLMGAVIQIINSVVELIIVIPLMGMSQVFQQGVAFITTSGADPIVALANMGVHYINFAHELWIAIIGISIATALIPVVGVVIFAIIMLAFPIFMAWMGVMLSVGFICSYYIPFVPYMIFTFGSIAWLMAVIEAMVAAPIVALGVTHPEGNEAFGKGEQAIMIILNVFLRPSMMVIGFFAGIILSYVSVWILNAGFQNASSFLQGDPDAAQFSVSIQAGDDPGRIDTQKGYTGWAGIYAFFFSILMYTTLYTIVVQKAFTLITLLPDKILRWIGGQPESIGAETAQWGEEAKGQVKEAGGATSKAAQAMDQQLSGYAAKGMKAVSGGGGGAQASVEKGAESTDSAKKGG
ncbi:MAG: type IVB secretion system protein DotA [Legionellaceae bacterium]|nr:type IVB secretion system protein DotA [Legionellaceae bacterium]